jgi:hypothetical protein
MCVDPSRAFTRFGPALPSTYRRRCALGIESRSHASVEANPVTTALRQGVLAGSCIGLWTLFFFRSPFGSLRLFVFRTRTVRNARTRRPTRHLFSRDTVSSVENVCQDEALMGVARNPLRDGAPPTGSTLEHCPTFRCGHGATEAGPRSLRRASSYIGSAMHDLGRGVPLFPFFCLPSSADEERSGLRRSSRRCSPSSKTIWSNALRSLLAQLPSNEALTFFARSAAGLVSPPASPVDCNLTRGRK